MTKLLIWTLYYRNQIQALDYSETMQFAIKESGAHKIVAKISKSVIILLLYNICDLLTLSLYQVCCQYFSVNNTIWILFNIFCIYWRNSSTSELIILVYIIHVMIVIFS